MEIYIGEVSHGNKGVCWAVNYGKEVKAYTPLVWGILFIFLIFVMFLLLILYLLWFYEKFPFKKRPTIKTESTDSELKK